MLSAPQPAALWDWFSPEQPGPLVGPHVLQTGHGTCFVDRWPGPRAVAAAVGGNVTLRGDPEALSAADVRPHLDGTIEAAAAFEPLLRAAFPALAVWERIIFELPGPPRARRYPVAAQVRRLAADDAAHVARLSPSLAWIAGTWDGPASLAASGYAWGAFVDQRLCSLACSFFVGTRYEDIGVVTEPAFRGRGLSTACAAGLCGDILARGRRPSWSTSLDNTSSRYVAERLGFVEHRRDRLLLSRGPMPEP